MLYFFHFLADEHSWLRIFKYITFRALMGAATAFVITLLIARPIIRWLRAKKIKQLEADTRVLEPQKKGKPGTPIMGGIIIIAAVMVSTLLWANPSNGYVLLTLGSMLFMGFVGFLDDWMKVSGKNKKGISSRLKMALQLFWGAAVAGALWLWPASREHFTILMAPFFKDPLVSQMWPWAAALIVIVVMVGATNAVNLTDGLDGLAIGCTSISSLVYLALAYIAGNAILAKHLLVHAVPGTGELAVFCGCLAGAGLGFLWYNCHPAQVFMGDTGSLSLGGAIAMVAISIKQELLLVIVGGVFVMEAVSVILQVASFKLTGKRIFLCAPIHHHFERTEKLKAQAEGRDIEVVETMITIRFWILAVICALAGLATLKIR